MVWRVVVVVVVDECDDDEREVDWRMRVVVQVVVEQMRIVLRMVPPLDVVVVETWLRLLSEQFQSPLHSKRVEDWT